MCTPMAYCQKSPSLPKSRRILSSANVAHPLVTDSPSTISLLSRAAPPSSSREVLADPLRRRRSAPIPIPQVAVADPASPLSRPRRSPASFAPSRRRFSPLQDRFENPVQRQWRLRRSPSTTDNDNATPLPPQEPPLPIRTHATVPPVPKVPNSEFADTNSEFALCLQNH
uniref:Uncharacterized protein n=1 Tax=Oryza nivara TaxID=4536 RepID=A0A0E0J9M0_ORYNI